jgi:sporulation protein YlmC with PRC-barrel domain
MSQPVDPATLGTAIHYGAVEKGTDVYDSAGAKVGEVRQIVDNYNEHILDGIVITDNDGEERFVDGPEVSRTFERGVLLSIDAAAVAQLAPPEDGPSVFGANTNTGRLSRLFGGAWKKK